MIYVISSEISFCVFADHESGGGDNCGTDDKRHIVLG